MNQSLLKNFINIHIALKEEAFELAYAFLQSYSFCGIEERFDEIVITFNSDDWNDSLRAEILDTLKPLDAEVEIIKEETIADKNWNEEWEKNVAPVRISDNIIITPEWKKDEFDAKYKIIINPKMSFGTGEHQTTRLVCRLMEKVSRPGAFWIDAGTGTGALAIFAAMLGAREVYAFDNNIWSIENAKENFELNGVSDKIKLEELDIENCELPDADFIAANLFLNLVVPSLPVFYKSLKAQKGDLLISGVLKYHLQDLLDGAERNNFEHIETQYEDDWIAVHLRAR
jgi:ribosomal protein L11 methyltransferase